jgi:nicotinamidase-related amidase
MSGVATSGVVLSTLRQASDMDFRITLLTDCVSDRDEDLDRCLKDRIFSRHAELHTAKQFVDLAARAGGDGHSLREPIG